jgi:hypothetical protein
MAIDYLAANRFGLGRRAGDPAPASAREAQAALVKQLGASTPHRRRSPRFPVRAKSPKPISAFANSATR